MSVKLHFLGTGCMIPSKERNHLSNALEYNGTIFLFDCGEGAQLQIQKMKLGFSKIKKIFISHFHGDHCIGLIGLLQTMSNTQGIEKIEIYGPLGAKKFINNMINCSIFSPSFEIKIIELKLKKSELKKIFENSEIQIFCASLNHSVPCLGYKFLEKNTLNINTQKLKKNFPNLINSPLLARIKMGLDIIFKSKKIKSKELTYEKKGLSVALIFDTTACPEISLLSKDCDYLLIEATYTSSHSKKADEFEHMTAKESSEIARENNVKNLILTHFSRRYKDLEEVEVEAKKYFEKTTIAKDLMTIELKK